MLIRSVNAQLWTLPLHAPFAISQRVAYHAENVMIVLESTDRNGTTIHGFGASAPAEYVTGETTQSVLQAVVAIADTLTGQSIGRLRPLLDLVSDALITAPAARAGLEIALYDLWAKYHRVSLWNHFGGARISVTTDMTIPITTPDVAAELALAAGNRGYRALKIKVGATEGVDADIERINAIVRAAPQVNLRIDANQAFTPQGAIDFAGVLQRLHVPVELIEQPVDAADLEGLKQVKDAIDYPVFADEAVCTPRSAWQLLQMNAVDGVNIKLMKSGIGGALQIVEMCRAAGKELMIGCMLETGLGIAAAMQIAAGTGAFQYVDLDSHLLLAPVDDVTGGFRSCGDQLEVIASEEADGWGVSVSQN